MKIVDWFKAFFKPRPATNRNTFIHSVTWQGSEEDRRSLEMDRQRQSYMNPDRDPQAYRTLRKRIDHD